ncbi:MAG: PAS domain S-box protein, partial [Gammaproteobacteria bacterium]|nr:PAS domain S-box protein [Gammaproteobacteria bacterium]
MDFIVKKKLGSSFNADTYIVSLPSDDKVLYRFKVIKPPFFDAALFNHLHQQLSYLEQLDIKDLQLPELIEDAGTAILKQPFQELQTLGEYLESEETLSPEQTLQLGIGLCEQLENRHAKAWVYKGIKPNNILYSQTSGALALLDDIETSTPKQLSHQFNDPGYCRESLPYQSPEQSSRIHSEIDHRSDLYSLGCVLYHCVAGRPPFISEQALEVAHSHLAEIPLALAEHQPEYPESLSNIIATLLEKQTEKRYQSATGLKKDLLACLDRLSRHNTSVFPLKRHDFSKEIAPPSILVGRQHEKQQLLDLYQQVCSGQLGVAYISGLTGIGKSRLVQELEAPILMRRGLFARGKYNQFSQHQPYDTLTQAIGTLVRQMLTETTERLEAWRSDILDVFGINGQLLTAVIPELSLLLGPQPDVTPLPPTEARNRFNDLFCRFFTCLAQKEHPLVLFVDDLQWCDDATLDLLELIVSNPEEHPYILLILAFRSDEVNARHRIQLTKELLNKNQTAFLNFELAELDKVAVNEITAYMLSSKPADIVDVTEVIYTTSGGNPLLVSESLRWLHHKGGVYYGDDGLWHWKKIDLAQLELPDNALALFTGKLSLLSPKLQNLLVHAALLGARFKATDLAELLDISLSDLLQQLADAFSQRFLLKDKSELYFFHDQLQMATAKLLSADEEKQIHRKIAKLLIRQSDASKGSKPPSKQGNLLYEIAEHLKKGQGKQASRAEKEQEAHFNYLAGDAAMKSLAHSSAAHYYSEAANLCSENTWSTQYDFMLVLYKSLARSLMLIGQHERANAYIDTALRHAKNDLDRAEHLLEQAIVNGSLGQLEENISLGKKCFSLLRDPFPEERDAAEDEMLRHLALLQDPDKYHNLPIATDRMAIIRMGVCSELARAYYFSGQVNLYFLTSMRGLTYALEQGVCSATTVAFGTTSVYFLRQHQYALAQQYEMLSIEEAEKNPLELNSISAITQCLWLTAHYTRSLSELQELCRTNIQNGLRSGELNHTGLSYMSLVWYQLTKGADLEESKHLVNESIEFCAKYNISLPLEICRATKLALAPIWGEPLTEEHHQAVAKKLSQWQEGQLFVVLCNFYIYRAMQSYHSDNFEDAEADLIAAQAFLEALSGIVIEQLWLVYRYLCGLQTGNNPDAKSQLEQVTLWAEHGPIMKPYLALMKAEAIALSTNNLDELRQAYWEAIDLSHAHGNHFHEAYIYQRLGTALDSRKHHSSQLYLNQAISLYQQCHADLFVNVLSERFQLTAPTLAINHTGLQSVPKAESSDKILDSTFLIEATQNIMKEHDYDSLLLKILSSIMARVGAKNAYLVTYEDNKLTVRVRGRKNASLETVRVNQEINTAENLCVEIARYTLRSKSPVVLENAACVGDFCHSQAVQYCQLKSVLTLPLIAQERTLGLIYLENALIPGVFSDEQVVLLQALTAQAAIALDNSQLISSLKESQESLMQREKNLAITLNSIGDGVIVTDSSGNISRLNPIAEKLTGWPIAEAKGKPVRKIFNIVDATTRETMLNPVDKVLSTGETVYLSNHTTLIAKDGQEYQISDSAAPVRNGDDNILGMVLVFNDVTEAYRLRKEIAESHNRLQQVMGDMHSMVATLSPEGAITFVNKKPLSLCGLNTQHVLNQRLWNSFWFNYDKHIQQQVKNACLSAAKGLQVNQDIQMQTLDGPIWIEFGLHPIRDEQGAINLLVWEGRDISSRKLAEEKLKEEQALQALTLDNLADAVIITNQSGIIQHFNASARAMFGYGEQEVIGKKVNLLMEEKHALAHDSYLEGYHRTSQSAIIGIGREVNAKRKNGDVFPFHITVVELPKTSDGQRRFVSSGQ